MTDANADPSTEPQIDAHSSDDDPGPGSVTVGGDEPAGGNEPWAGDTVPGDEPDGPSTGHRPEEREL